jgi:hypothetical protein
MRRCVTNFEHCSYGNFTRQLASDLHEVPSSKAVTIALYDRNKARSCISYAMNMG